jgi:hypothetical protein
MNRMSDSTVASIPQVRCGYYRAPTAKPLASLREQPPLDSCLLSRWTDL